MIYLRKVPLAVIGTVLEVDEVGLVGPLELGLCGPQPRGPAATSLGQSHHGRALVQLGERRASHPERWQLPPADAHAARARHACGRAKVRFITSTA